MGKDSLFEINLLTRLFDSVQYGIAVLDSDLKIIKHNSWLKDKVDNIEEIVGEHCIRAYCTLEMPCGDCPVRKTFNTKRPQKGVYENIFKKDKSSIYEISTYPIFGEKEQVEYVIVNYTDISHLKKMENELLQKNNEFYQINQQLDEQIRLSQEKEQHYRLIVENQNELIVKLDCDFKLLFANPNYFKTFNLTPDKIIGEYFISLVHPDDVGNVEKSLMSIKDGNSKTYHEERVKVKDMWTWFGWSLNALRDNDGNIQEVIAVGRDISKQKKAEEEIKKFKKISDEALYGSAIATAEGKVIYCNEYFAKIHGYKSEELIDKSILTFHSKSQKEEIMKILSDIVDGKDTKPLEIEHLHKNGTVFTMLMSFNLTKNEKGKVKYVSTTAFDITEQKKYERLLLESQNKFKSYVQNAPYGIFVANENGKYVDVNKAASESTGYSVDELLKMGISDLHYHEDSEFGAESFVNLVKNNKNVDIKIRYVRKNGEVRYWNVYAVKLDKNRYLGFTNDISKRVEAEEKLHDSLNHLEKILLVAPTGIGIVEKQKIKEVNNQICLMTGYSPEELIGQDSSVLYPTIEEHTYVKEVKYSQIKKYGTGVVETHWKTKKGKLIDVFLASATKDGDYLEGEVVFTALDITKRNEYKLQLEEKNSQHETLNQELKQINQELKNEKEKSIENSKRLNNLISNLQGLVYRCKNDENWTMIFLSTAIEDLTGYRVDEVIYNNIISWNDIVLKEDREKVHSIVSKSVSKKESFDLEYRIKCRNSEVKWVWEKGLPVFSDSKFSHIEGFITDITPIKKIENELKIAKEKSEQANKLKTEFLNNMSHEIRTPMNGILGFAELLNTDDISQEQQDYFIKIIQNSSNQLLRIIDDILEISTLETKQLKLFESEFLLNDLLMELFSVFSMTAQERNIHIYLKKELSDSESKIISDKSKISKILSNLLENALKFTNVGYVELGYYLKDKMICIYVKDTGIGIDLRNQKQIFERFSQENSGIVQKYGGLGLGLSISLENAHLLGGDITLESEKGKGTTFFVSIPYKTGKVEIPESKQSNVTKPIETGDLVNILIVEDEEINFLYFEAICENYKNIETNLIHARNGIEAVESCRGNTDIDIVFMDIKLPLLNGFDATLQIKEIRPNLPIIAQTAYTSLSDRERALESGCDDFISKPVDKGEFLDLIKKYTKNVEN